MYGIFYLMEDYYMLWKLICNTLAKDELKVKELALKEIEQGRGSYTEQSNRSLILLNKNIINLNFTTTVYSKILVILTFVILALTIVLVIKR